jgi:glycosyltransferase involved in cell wall biosynthesis
MNESEWPLVSAVMLCYNQARFAVECLEGIKAQKYPNLELIVADDASGDESAAVIQSWLSRNPDLPHRFLRNRVNQGMCRTLNSALARCNGKYFSGIAADDVWLPGKLCGQVALIERLSDKVGVVYGDALRMNPYGTLLPPTFLEDVARHHRFSQMPQGNVQMALWRGNFIAPMTTLIRRECFNRAGTFDESCFAEDWELWLRISRYYDFVYWPELSAKYRKVATSICNSQQGRLTDDETRTCIKHLRAGYLQGQLKKAAVRKLYNLAICSYEFRSLNHKRNLLTALRYRPTPGIGLRCLFAFAGIGPGHFADVRPILSLDQRLSVRN